MTSRLLAVMPSPIAQSPPSDDDEAFIARVPAAVLHSFRDHLFPEVFIKKNPHMFLSTDWVQASALREFVRSRHEEPMIISSSPLATPTRHLHATRRVKLERPDLDLTESSSTRVKAENTDVIDLSSSPVSQPVRVRVRSMKDKSHEVLEILSSEDEDGGSELVNEAHQLDMMDIDMDVVVGTEKQEDNMIHQKALCINTVLAEVHELPVSDVNWQGLGDGIQSKFRSADDDLASFKVTRQLKVKRIEYLAEIPSFWPVPRVPTAYVVDLRDSRFDIAENGKRLRADALIKNKDQDCWTGGTGTADTTADVFLFGIPITCRRSRLKCRGCFACGEVDSKLLEVVRHELDPAARDAIFAAEMRTRVREGTVGEDTVITFWSIIHAKPCRAEDENGVLCSGKPRLAVWKKPSRGKTYFIGCTGWRPNFKKDHIFFVIPDHVDENILAKAFKGEALKPKPDDKCSRVVSPHVGLKVKYCAYPHMTEDGKPLRSPIVHHKCHQARSIFVPQLADEDARFRVAIVVPDHERPHSHPMPPMLKVSVDLKAAYVECIEGLGILGATVRKVDHASSSKVILKGKTLGEFHPALLQGRKKRKLIAETKLNSNPHGLGIEGVWHLYTADLEKPIEERYIHSIVSTAQGGLIILTFESYLARLIHEATSFEVDTTFKRAAGNLNEWEMVIWYAALLRTVTIGRVYTNRADREYYKTLFDECQKVLRTVTGKPMRFKRLSKGGNLLAMNVDLEAAQVLGAGDSFLATNEPDYSGINTTEADEIVQYFTRACYAHVKRPIHDFKSIVSPTDYKYMMEFPYMKSDEEIEAFTAFCRSSGSKKIKDWWEHKLQHKWILPAIMKAKSSIHPEDWDKLPATTNAGEAQHHWTNEHTGTRLSLLEAIQSAREIDRKTASDIRISIESGVMVNANNDTLPRMARSIQRQTKASQQAKAIAERVAAVQTIREEMNNEKALRKESIQREKALQETLQVTQATRSKGKGTRAVKSKKTASAASADASSSGRVANSSTSRRRAVRSIADPYLIERLTLSHETAPDQAVAADLSNFELNPRGVVDGTQTDWYNMDLDKFSITPDMAAPIQSTLRLDDEWAFPTAATNFAGVAVDGHHYHELEAPLSMATNVAEHGIGYHHREREFSFPAATDFTGVTHHHHDLQARFLDLGATPSSDLERNISPLSHLPIDDLDRFMDGTGGLELVLDGVVYGTDSHTNY